MRAANPLTKQEERKLLAELDRERHERERDLPAEERHPDPAWVAEFWKRLAS